MKILLTGGGTGGHFYPIIAVAESIRKIVKEDKLLDAELYYMAPSRYDDRALFENQIIYVSSYAGKMRRYFSLLNVVDTIKTALGILKATVDVWRIYPDVVFSKGGYVSVPVLFAARLLRIPVVIHESDSHPGRANLWAAKFAQKIALSYGEAAKYFAAPGITEKVAFTGNPIRKEIQETLITGADQLFGITESAPMILIIGGSQGSQKMNEAIIGILPELVKKYYVVHQTGKNNIEEMTSTANVILRDSVYASRYKPLAYLNNLTLRTAAGQAAQSGLIISRAGSQIFEIALWGIPSIIIPIPEAISHDQTSNAFAYQTSGACSVIEESNLTPHVLLGEIDRIIENTHLTQTMKAGATKFARKDAADTIARELIRIALTHAE